MKYFLLLLLTVPAFARPLVGSELESTPEFLVPESLGYGRAQPIWEKIFIHQDPDGKETVLAQENSDVPVKPASTMKLFTSWMAFKTRSRDEAYLGKMLKESVNAMANATLKKMGGPSPLKKFYEAAGLPLGAPDFIQVDGSGLSYSNRASCDVEIALLKLMLKDPEFPSYKLLLAEPTEPGTLEKRLGEYKGRMFAKTGTLAQTVALSGFVEGPEGLTIFCIIGDNHGMKVASARAKLDGVVRSLVP